jgi:hypothetical protein
MRSAATVGGKQSSTHVLPDSLAEALHRGWDRTRWRSVLVQPSAIAETACLAQPRERPPASPAHSAVAPRRAPTAFATPTPVSAHAQHRASTVMHRTQVADRGRALAARELRGLLRASVGLVLPREDPRIEDAALDPAARRRRSGASASTKQSTIAATSISLCPTPTVSTSTTSKPAARTRASPRAV